MNPWRFVPKFRLQQELKRKKVAESTTIWKSEANEIIARSKTVKTFEEQWLELRNKVSTSFVSLWLAMIWLLTLAGLPRAVSNSQPYHYRKEWKEKELSNTWVSSKNQLMKSEIKQPKSKKNFTALAKQFRGTQQFSNSLIVRDILTSIKNKPLKTF